MWWICLPVEERPHHPSFTHLPAPMHAPCRPPATLPKGGVFAGIGLVGSSCCTALGSIVDPLQVSCLLVCLLACLLERIVIYS